MNELANGPANGPVSSSGPEAQEARAAARALVQWNLAALGAGFAWFAYVDAPITDGAMWLFAGAVFAGLLSLVAALLVTDVRRPPFGARARRLALLLFAACMTLLLAAATVTLNLKGTGSDDAGTQTAEVVPT